MCLRMDERCAGRTIFIQHIKRKSTKSLSLKLIVET